MNKFKLIVCALIITALTCGITFYQDTKPIAEDLPYLDGIIVR